MRTMLFVAFLAAVLNMLGLAVLDGTAYAQHCMRRGAVPCPAGTCRPTSRTVRALCGTLQAVELPPSPLK